MIKLLLFMAIAISLSTSCSLFEKKQKSQFNRVTYYKKLVRAKEGKSKKEYSYFLSQELRKKQGELNALEGMQRNEETFLSSDEQRERVKP